MPEVLKSKDGFMVPSAHPLQQLIFIAERQAIS